ncbi:MAG TPA: AraC family transcriptional regulator [Verrucomicrobiae bacterium]|nr:AraC family transcriptional regulator [Verrucomicrobiae bacterium]
MQPGPVDDADVVEAPEAPTAEHLTFVEPSPIARRLLWHLFSIGSRRITESDRHQSFEKPGAHLFWVQSGEGELEHEKGRLALARGRKVWLVDMSKPRTYLPAAKRHLTIAGFRFGGPGLEFWHEEIRGTEGPEFALSDFGFVKRTQSELLRLVRRRPVGWEWQIHVVITNMLGKLLMARKLLVSPQAELPAPVVRVLNAISANPMRDWKATELASIGKVSYSGLRAMFQKAKQGTIHEHIQRARLDQARLLLADKRLSVKDVAAQLNFSSEFYFSHFFRHYTGMTPTEFRQHLKG